MEKATFLSDAFREKAEALLQAVKKIAQTDYRNKDLKKVRVNLKKMRAILLLLVLIDRDFKEKNQLKDSKPLFKKAGALRDHWINRQLLDQYWLSKQCRALLDERLDAQEQHQRKKLRQVVQDFDAAHLEKAVQRVEDLCAETSFSAIRDQARLFIDDKIALIRQMADLHDVRRHLRIVTALATLFSEYGRAIMPAKQLQTYRQLQGQLGDWHDREVLMELEKDFMTNLPELSIREEWARFMHKLQIENAEQMKLLQKELRRI